MTFPLDQSDADKLDHLIKLAYPTLGGGELSQLAKLFNNGHLVNALKSVLTPHLAPPGRGGTDSVDVRIAWIDKRPYALMTGESSRVELADTAVFYFQMSAWNGGINCREARCLLLQAKVAKTATQIAAPTVCINPAVPPAGSTTERELRLLSTWPPFDLYLSSKNNTPIVFGLNVAPASKPAPPHGWFMGTPRTSPTPAQERLSWPSPWMCAPAQQGQACDEALGRLLARHLCGGQLTSAPANAVAAGEAFSYDPKNLAAPGPNCTGWDRLCVEILRAVRDGDIPPHLTNGVQTGKSQAATLHSLPFVPAVSSAIDWLSKLFSGGRRERMPVLLISRIYDERH